MQETRSTLERDVDAELEGIITALAAAQQQRREALRRRLRRQIEAMLQAQGFSVGDIFPVRRYGGGGRARTKATG